MMRTAQQSTSTIISSWGCRTPTCKTTQRSFPSQTYLKRARMKTKSITSKHCALMSHRYYTNYDIDSPLAHIEYEFGDMNRNNNGKKLIIEDDPAISRKRDHLGPQSTF